MRYQRHLSPEFEQYLCRGKALRFLLDGAVVHREKPAVLDAQFREKNVLMLYAGLTRVLHLRYDHQRAAFKVGADPAYDIQGKGVQKSYRVAEMSDLAADLRNYLACVRVANRYLDREGECQTRVSQRFGQLRTDSGDWATVDREAVIGFDGGREKDEFWRPILSKAQAALDLLACQRGFGTRIGVKRLGDEADLILWDPISNQFVVAELKDGGSASGVYLSALQVACYAEAWRSFAAQMPEAALGGLRSLLQQKQRLGLIGGECALPKSPSDLRFRPAVIVRNPNERSGCWEKLRCVRSAVDQAWGCSCDSGPLGELAFYGLCDGSMTPLTHAGCM